MAERSASRQQLLLLGGPEEVIDFFLQRFQRGGGDGLGFGEGAALARLPLEEGGSFREVLYLRALEDADLDPTVRLLEAVDALKVLRKTGTAL